MKRLLVLSAAAFAAVLAASSPSHAQLSAEYVNGDIDKFNDDPDWTPVEGHCDVIRDHLVNADCTCNDTTTCACSNADCTDLQLSPSNCDVEMTFDFNIGTHQYITAAYIEFWGLDVEARATSHHYITLDGDITLDCNPPFDLPCPVLNAVPGWPADPNDYVTLSRYDLAPSDLTKLSDGILSVELFSHLPTEGDAFALDFVRLVVEYDPTIPTVSQWGLVAMTLLMLTVGTLVYARRTAIHA